MTNDEATLAESGAEHLSFPEGALSESDVEKQALGQMAVRRHHLTQKIASVSAPFTEAIAALAEEIEQTKEQQAAAVAGLERDIEFIDSQMESVFRRRSEQNGEKTFKLPFVTYGLRRSPDTVEIADAAKLLELCQQTPALLDSLFTKKVSIQPNKRSIMAHIKGTGEVLDGVEFKPGEVRFKVIQEGGVAGAVSESDGGDGDEAG
ncbi:MAG: host-nuclease inhibitor Gam family protein [Acidobacteriaceae bacterium]